MQDDKEGIIRRASYIVEDVEVTASFYEKLFGWTRFYDNKTTVDYRFPPCAPDGTLAHIIILKADDPYIGMVGFMEYDQFSATEKINKERRCLGVGDTINVIEVNDIDAVYERAKKLGARLVSAPVDWSVTDYSGKGVIKLATFSFFDANGLYFEVNSRRN
jgi:predicted enzyme related to lactoylglutathione lyase